MQEKNAAIAPLLLAWYDRAGRDLPWRVKQGRADPYRVWLSEIMLQQTTVAAVKPYYEKFLRRWPAIADLAHARSEEIMEAWAGLGYYSRARNLHACAQAVLGDHSGTFPDDEAALRKLPGIGPYTAAAIAAIAFNRRAVVMDANVERVVARLFGEETPLPTAKPKLYALTDAITPDERPGDFAQAMMDLGATICMPKNPRCDECPIRNHCAGLAQNMAERLPQKTPKAKRRQKWGYAYIVIHRDGHILLERRPPQGLLGGMAGFPLSLEASEHEFVETTQPDWQVGPRIAQPVTHIFTHLEVSVEIVIFYTEKKRQYEWRAPREIDAMGLPTLMAKIWRAFRQSEHGSDAAIAARLQPRKKRLP